MSRSRGGLEKFKNPDLDQDNAGEESRSYFEFKPYVVLRSRPGLAAREQARRLLARGVETVAAGGLRLGKGYAGEWLTPFRASADLRLCGR